jgi:hypothetical protein
MDVLRMLGDLREERERLMEAILVLERIAAGGQRRRGRPPKWMAAIAPSSTDAPSTGKRRQFSAATRAKMAAAQRKRWAARKKAVA